MFSRDRLEDMQGPRGLHLGTGSNLPVFWARRGPMLNTMITVGTVTMVFASCTVGSLKVPPTEYVVRDSARIRIVENNTTRPLGRVALLPAQRMDRNTEVLVNVSGMHSLPDSRLAVLNAGMHRLIVLDSAGRVHQAIGRHGEGPAEFGGPGRLFACTGDTLLVYEKRSALVSVFSSEAHFVRRTRALSAPVGAPWNVAGVTRDCATLVVARLEVPTTVPLETTVLPVALFWHDLESGVARPSATVSGFEMAAGLRPLPFGAMPSWAVGGDELYVGSGLFPEVRVYHRSGGLVRVIRWRAERVRITGKDRATYRKSLAALTAEFGRTAFPPLEDIELPARKPVYSRMLVDSEANLWVQRYPVAWPALEATFGRSFDTMPTEWWVFDPTGRLVGLAELPGGLLVLGIGDGRIAGVRQDPEGKEGVEVYRMRSDLIKHQMDAGPAALRDREPRAPLIRATTSR